MSVSVSFHRFLVLGVFAALVGVVVVQTDAWKQFQGQLGGGAYILYGSCDYSQGSGIADSECMAQSGAVGCCESPSCIEGAPPSSGVCQCLAGCCGNGMVDAGEECDDGNTAAGDGCSNNCKNECWQCESTTIHCMTVEATSCTGGSLYGTHLECSSNCGLSGPRCGNGIVEGDEECDDGNHVFGDGCDECEIGTVCGDGVVEGDEECEDGNTVAGDGCNNCYEECYMCDSGFGGCSLRDSICSLLPPSMVYDTEAACTAGCDICTDDSDCDFLDNGCRKGKCNTSGVCVEVPDDSMCTTPGEICCLAASNSCKTPSACEECETSGCDECPDDPDKKHPLECGCGVPDTDSDGDGVPDCNDGCPLTWYKTDPGDCGCDMPDTDANGDGVSDCLCSEHSDCDPMGCCNPGNGCYPTPDCPDGYELIDCACHPVDSCESNSDCGAGSCCVGESCIDESDVVCLAIYRKEGCDCVPLESSSSAASSEDSSLSSSQKSSSSSSMTHIVTFPGANCCVQPNEIIGPYPQCINTGGGNRTEREQRCEAIDGVYIPGYPAACGRHCLTCPTGCSRGIVDSLSTEPRCEASEEMIFLGVHERQPPEGETIVHYYDEFYCCCPPEEESEPEEFPCCQENTSCPGSCSFCSDGASCIAYSGEGDSIHYPGEGVSRCIENEEMAYCESPYPVCCGNNTCISSPNCSDPSLQHFDTIGECQDSGLCEVQSTEDYYCCGTDSCIPNGDCAENERFSTPESCRESCGTTNACTEEELARGCLTWIIDDESTTREECFCPCDNDSDCPNGICEQGQCRERECENDDECSEGICEESRCEEGCRDNDDCPIGICVEGSCDPCEDHNQCETNLCVNGNCEKCEDDDDCEEGSECDIDGKCSDPDRGCCEKDGYSCRGACNFCEKGKCPPDLKSYVEYDDGISYCRGYEYFEGSTIESARLSPLSCNPKPQHSSSASSLNSASQVNSETNNVQSSSSSSKTIVVIDDDDDEPAASSSSEEAKTESSTGTHKSTKRTTEGSDDDDGGTTRRRSNPTCGDGVINQNFEQCEVGEEEGLCPSSKKCNIYSCTCERGEFCGDGVVQPSRGEECEGTDGTYCSNNQLCNPLSCECEATPFCGDGIIQQDRGENCEVGFSFCGEFENCNLNTCSCTSTAACGDSVLQVERGEECEVGYTNLCIRGRQCDISACKCIPVAAEILCGNGIVEPGEQCDDGNTRDGDGCNAVCILELSIVASAKLCGNGLLEAPEECDDGNTINTDGCTNQCTLRIPAFCGNGLFEPPEECDAGSSNSFAADATCRPDCTLPFCGDGIKAAHEECDDGNQVDGDGCESTCRVTVASVAANGVDVDNGTSVQTQGINTPFEVPLRQLLGQNVFQAAGVPPQMELPYQIPFAPTTAPGQFPVAQLQPLIQTRAPVGDTGPAAVVVVASGMAAGLGWIRRKKLPPSRK